LGEALVVDEAKLDQSADCSVHEFLGVARDDQPLGQCRT
jgi:hypothetical protein